MDTLKLVASKPRRNVHPEAAAGKSLRKSGLTEALKSKTTVSVRMRREPAPAQEVPSHRFQVGDWVHIAADPAALARVGGLYRILARLPPQPDGRFQYRVRSEAERFERIVKEDEIGPTAQV